MRQRYWWQPVWRYEGSTEMGGINLLPWREERRKRQQRNFALLTGAALAATALALVVVHLEINRRIEFQQQRNQLLTGELALLDQKIKEIQDLEKQKKSLIARMDVIQQLQISRPEAVHLFDELARTVPEGLRLVDLAQNDRTIAVNGVAQSNARVSVYMRNLDQSPWFQEPALQVIEAKPQTGDKKDRQVSRFSLQFKQTDKTAIEADQAKPPIRPAKR
jgi:type IV pilus assembly protein PilN